MSDTRVAMREFRFLDEKRKLTALSHAEEQRWIELGHLLGGAESNEAPMEVDPTDIMEVDPEDVVLLETEPWNAQPGPDHDAPDPGMASDRQASGWTSTEQVVPAARPENEAQVAREIVLPSELAPAPAISDLRAEAESRGRAPRDEPPLPCAPLDAAADPSGPVINPLESDTLESSASPKPSLPRKPSPLPKPEENSWRGGLTPFGDGTQMLGSTFVQGDHRVIIHTLEGQVKRGTVRDVDLLSNSVPIDLQSGEGTEDIAVNRIKAIFFMLSPGTDRPPPQGQKICVGFQDGREVVGFSNDHKSSDPGFFLTPADSRTNTARIYIFRWSVAALAEQ